jgi:ribokinase
VFDVVVVGSANVDLVVRADRIPRPGETLIGESYDEYPGGKGLNQAVAAARSGSHVAFVGALGVDDAGRRLREVTAADRIDTSSTPSIEKVPSGRALITVVAGGENTIIVVPGANDLVDGRDAPVGSVVLAQLEVPMAAVIAAFTDARGRGATTILNPAPAAALPDQLLRLTDVIVPNEHEIDLIGGVDALLAAGVRTVIVTRGAAGADVTSAAPTRARGEPTTTSYPAIEVEVLDTTAAGDAFCGALAARLAAGDEVDDAVRWAICAGGLATTRHGAVPSLPTNAEILVRQAADDAARSRPSRRANGSR